MIYESYPWKQDLLRRKRLIQKYNRVELLSEDDDRAYTAIEKAIFYSAFIIRKLIDCKCKVSDDVDAYKFTMKGYAPLKDMNIVHHSLDDNSHDWEHGKTYTKSGAEVCNWLIHSYIFTLFINEDGVYDSFAVSSDYDRNKILYLVQLKDWIAYMDFVGKDYIVASDMHADEKREDYIYTKKERGSL